MASNNKDMSAMMDPAEGIFRVSSRQAPREGFNVSKGV